MATNPNLIEEAKGLNIELTGTETEAQLKKLIKDAKKANKGSGEGQYVWVKVRAYINDTQRVDAGLYLLSEIPERFTKMTADAVKIFEETPSTRELSVIAKWAGLDAVELSDEEVLERLTSEFLPFL
jgi:uncharacterized protein (DUF1786 family)